MDRLQQAIQKAREERNNRQQLQPVPPADIQPPPAPQESGDQDIWLAVPEIQIEQRLISRNRLMSFHGGADATPYDMLRTKMLQQTISNNWHRVALTSLIVGAAKVLPLPIWPSAWGGRKICAQS